MIRSNLEQSIWIKGPSDRSDQLLTSVVNLLNRSQQLVDSDLSRYATGALAAVAVAALPIAALVSAWAILPLMAIAFWTLFHWLRASGFASRRRLRRLRKQSKTHHNREQLNRASQSSDSTNEPVPRNRLTEHQPGRNGAATATQA